MLSGLIGFEKQLLFFIFVRTDGIDFLNIYSYPISTIPSGRGNSSVRSLLDNLGKIEHPQINVISFRPVHVLW